MKTVGENLDLWTVCVIISNFTSPIFYRFEMTYNSSLYTFFLYYYDEIVSNCFAGTNSEHTEASSESFSSGLWPVSRKERTNAATSGMLKANGVWNEIRRCLIPAAQVEPAAAAAAAASELQPWIQPPCPLVSWIYYPQCYSVKAE